ncbi:hypothetical protein GmHk_15G044634 [Glycine max]|nr:hypothetical protein GmHk_15G044634 [Glycine max]
MARVMLGNGYEPGMGLGKDNGGITSLINAKGNRGKYGLGYKPTQADIKRSIAGRKSGGQSSQLRQESEGSPPCHISRSFISAGLGDEGQVVAIYEDDVPSTLDLVRPCPPDFQLGNWLEMAPRKLASKRPRKDKAAEGTSSAPEYDSHRFRSAVHQQRFEAIKGWSFLRERCVQLRDDEYTDFQEEIGRRRWTSLVTPMAKFDPEIRQAQDDAPQAAGAPPPPHQAGQAGSFDMGQYLRHLVRQQAANHRAHVQTHDCLYQMSLSMQSQGFAAFSCPTPDQFRAEVTWPGDWPEAQAGEAPPEAPGDGEEAHEDEEMADLLDFLGGISMGTNQTGKRFYQVKVKSLDTTSIKELGRLMEPLQMQAFRKTYGKILELTIAEVSIEAIASLTQYYDQPLRCFTFADFQLVPTIEEFEVILGCPLGGRKPYLSSGCLPSLSRIATVVKDSARGLDRIKQTRNGIAGLPQKYLEDKARGMANQGDWVPFMDVLALLIFGVVLFPNVDGLVDLAAIDAFLAYHHSKESPVVAVLADLFDTFDRRCEKSSARIICCLPALCVWLEGKEGVLFSCGGYPNIPLVGTRGCINYNPALAIRQLGYPMRGAPTEESTSPFLVRDFGAQNSKTIQRIHKAWETPLRKDQELRSIRNGIIGGYHEWLKVHIRGLDWLAKLKVVSEESFEAPEEDEEVQALKSELGKAKLAKEKFKLAATHVRKECAGLREENAITARALEQETKRARKEEYGRNKFRGALWGSNSELKLRREERDQSRAHSMVLKEELVACSRSKRSLSQRLCETETNMLAIIAKYQEELGLATAHEHRIADEYAQVYAEKEARGRVIDSLHQEATMWMDRFALTLNGSQELPRLLAKAKAMADTYSAPEEIHGLLGYCQHMIDLMAHIIRNLMGEVEEIQEKMKADMEAMKEQMATMMEAMMSMKKIMEANAVIVAATSVVAKVNPTSPSGLKQMNHPTSNMVGKDLGSMGGPHDVQIQNEHAFPSYGLPPNYTPPNSPSCYGRKGKGGSSKGKAQGH